MITHHYKLAYTNTGKKPHILNHDTHATLCGKEVARTQWQLGYFLDHLPADVCKKCISLAQRAVFLELKGLRSY